MMIKPRVLDSDQPYGPYNCKASDIWMMFCAASAGETGTLHLLLEADPNLAHCEYWYTQPLHFAVREGQLEACRVLLDYGADPQASGAGREDLLTLARDRGHEPVALLLEARRVKQKRTDPVLSEDHPVHDAAAKGETERVRQFLDEDPNLVHLGDSMGGTPLHRAVAACAHDTIKLLLDRGANIHARFGSGPGNAKGYAPVDFEPIDLSLWRGPFWNVRGDLATARLLISLGAKVDIVIAAAIGDEPTVRRCLEEHLGNRDHSRPCGKRALSSAIEFGHNEIAQLLLAAGASPNAPEGSTAPRGVALHAASRTGNLAIVNHLLQSGADPNATIDASGSAVYVAETQEIRALLLQHGATLDAFDMVWLGEDDELIRRVEKNPDWADTGCGGAIAAACTLGKQDLLERLLAAGARVPAVLTACRSYLLHNPEMLAILLERGMNPNLPNWQNATPLHDLCGRDGRGRAMEHRIACANLLLAAGADINARDDVYRSTPLAWAARENLPDMVAWLLERGAPKTLPDDQSWATPATWAKRRGHEDITALLG